MRKQEQTKQPKKPVVTAEDAERMYAQAWPAKQEAVSAEVQTALETIGDKYGVIIRYQVAILPTFLAQPAQGNLPPQP